MLSSLPTSEIEMRRVTGTGGIFFNAKDPKALCAWYKRHLGLDVQEWGRTAFTWTDAAGNPAETATVRSIRAATAITALRASRPSRSIIASRT
jgi:hypothetical protein